MNFHYFTEGPNDQFLNAAEANRRQNGLRDLAEKMLNENSSNLAGVAVKLVEEHSLLTRLDDSEKNRLEESYWVGVFEQPHCSKIFWDDLFKDRKYLEENIAELIPDDKYQRLVFHFVHKWQTRFATYFLDKDVPEECKVAVLKKQVENIAFISRERVEGSAWQMRSKPDDLLKEALGAAGQTVVIEDENGTVVTDIIGHPISVVAHEGIPQDAADGPQVDDLDKKLYEDITSYTEKHLGKAPSRSWTMVRCLFRTTDHREIRCFAFSGSSDSSKKLHEMPQRFWKDNKFKAGYFVEDRDIFICNVDRGHLGQNMILMLFLVLRQDIKKDLDILTEHIAYDEKEAAQLLISEQPVFSHSGDVRFPKRHRSDQGTLDYGEYYDIVVEKINQRDRDLKCSIRAVVSKKYDDNVDELANELWTLVSNGCKNKQFKPNFEELNTFQERLDVDGVGKICKISENLLSKLKSDLDELPEKFLKELEKRFQRSHCAEDNVLSLVLEKFISNVEIFLLAKVSFVAMDKNNPNGKPFCEVCDRKVRFYSLLPTFLSCLGVTGHNKLMGQLETLFESCFKN